MRSDNDTIETFACTRTYEKSTGAIVGNNASHCALDVGRCEHHAILFNQSAPLEPYENFYPRLSPRLQLTNRRLENAGKHSETNKGAGRLKISALSPFHRATRWRERLFFLAGADSSQSDRTSDPVTRAL